MVTLIAASTTQQQRRSSRHNPYDPIQAPSKQLQRTATSCKCQTPPHFHATATRLSGGGVLGSLAALNTTNVSATPDPKHEPQKARQQSPPYRRHSINNNFYVPPAYRRGLAAATPSTTAIASTTPARAAAPVCQPRPVLLSSGSNATAPPCNQGDASQIADEETYRRQRATDFKVGRNLFNRNAEQGMAYLILRGFVQPNPNAIATMFSSRLGLNRQRIGEFLSTPSNQSQLAASVLSRLAASVDMAGVDVDIALRRFLELFHLPGEAQRIERILRVFAHHYCLQNDAAFAFLSSDCTFGDKCDTALLLAYAIVMLNTDLHSPAIRECRMSQADFICNFQGAGKNAAAMPAETLAAIYERIRLQALTPSEDNTTNVSRIEEAIIGRRQPLVASQRRLVCYCCLVELRGDPLRGCQKQQGTDNNNNNKPPTSHSSSSSSATSAGGNTSNRRCSFPASFTEGLRSRQSDVKHGADRQLFLFNDLLVVTKLGRRRGGNSGANKRTSLSSSTNHSTSTPNQQREVFLFRRALPLLGLSFATFSTPSAPFGIRLTTVEENAKMPSTLFLCARTAEDHQHFVHDLQEAIAEAALTEAARLDLEKCPMPILEKLFDPSDFEDVASIFSDPNTVSASSLTVADEVHHAVCAVSDDCSPTGTPTHSGADVNSASSSTSGNMDEAIIRTTTTTNRLSRRHSRTSLDSGVGEIGSQMSIAVANSVATDNRPRAIRQRRDVTKPSQHQLYGSRSAEKHSPDSENDAKVTALSPEPCSSDIGMTSSSTSSNNAQSRSRARSADTLC